MDKIKVGILPLFEVEEDGSYQDDYYKFVNLYAKRIFECNAIPIGILMDDGNLNYEILDMCDAFLIPGGKRINKYVYETIYYAIKNNKPLLGICLGSQAINIFSNIYEKMDKNRDYTADEVIEIYQKLKSEYEGTLLRKIPTPHMHGAIEVKKNEINDHYHEIDISSNTILYDIVKSNKLNVVSLHNYDYKHVGEDFIVTAYASDGVHESIEYNKPNYFILGVHFHPEIMGDNRFFERLIEEAKNRI